MSISDPVPPGFTLRHTLRGHSKAINRIAWSPDTRTLASSSSDNTIRLWDTETGQQLRTLKGHSYSVNSIAWSPDGRFLASGSDDETVRFWDVKTGRHLASLTGQADILCVAWSPDGKLLASSSYDKTVRLWHAKKRRLLATLTGHSQRVLSVAWSPDGQVLASAAHTIRLWDPEEGQQFAMLSGHLQNVPSVAWSPDGQVLASASGDKTIRLWDPSTRGQTDILEGHTDSVTSVSFNCDGQLLASKSHDGTVRIWRIDRMEMVAILDEPGSTGLLSGLAFHPKAPVLATLGEGDTVIRVWDLDVATLLESTPTTPMVHYMNAKIILVGDSGVGKTGLGLVLAGQPFVPTESTHGRHVWPFDNQEVTFEDERRETREMLLWDLAGQPGYRLIHQLHLNEIVVALIVFDSHSETDPFAGVYHWVRALRTAQRIQGNTALPMKKFLVAARIDRGGRSVSRARLDVLVQELGIDGYFETSAKEGKNISILAEAMKDAVEWKKLPRVTSTDLFQHVKAFLIAEKETGRLLSPCNDLYRSFLNSEHAPTETNDLDAQFETCIGRVESQGLIRRLNFGNLVLLQPELLDAYASALIHAVRDEPDGLGSISEEKVQVCDFYIPDAERISDREQEKFLLIAMVEDLLRYEITLREQGEDGPYLVFPSQSTRENPHLPDPEGKAVVFDFEGPIMNVYATLAVRLSHSGLFQKREIWKNAVTYTTKVGGTYGMFLNNIEEGRAELILFFNKEAREETRFHFEEYVYAHLQRRALRESLKRRRIFTCGTCGAIMTDQIVRMRIERGFTWLDCSVCSERVLLVDREERLRAEPSAQVLEMDRVADNQRDHEAAKSTMQGKVETRDFDVFLCHNGKNKPEVKRIGEKLKERGVLPWLDEWELRPGLPWQRLLEQQIEQIRSAAVFVGKDGIGPWQQEELEVFLREFMKRRSPVIPVLLPDAPMEPKLPLFLSNRTWVDFRGGSSDPIEQLIWGITGKRNWDR